MNITNHPLLIITLLLLLGILVYYFQRKSELKRKREKFYGGKPHSKSNRRLENEVIKNRIDKLEVDVTFIKDFTIKEKANPSTDKSTPITDKAEIKSPLVNLIKDKGEMSTKRMFSDEQIVKEMKRKLLENGYAKLTHKDYSLQWNKAYKRLWARKNYISNKNK